MKSDWNALKLLNENSTSALIFHGAMFILTENKDKVTNKY